ncbi:MAG TPA: hypothetical protein VFN22_14140 [Gemmatimonadales bacterium]|nr:hypothetical protein [Gemmatimonadales bacterium]
MASSTPYRLLPDDTRLMLVTQDLKANSGSRASYIMRMVAKGGGFRPETLRKWKPEQLARDIIRRKLETLQDEIGYLQLLYVELQPEIQIAFCDAAGVAHENGSIPEALPMPLASAERVRAAADSLVSSFGERGRHYLVTIATYNAEAWPGLAEWLESNPAT